MNQNPLNSENFYPPKSIPREPLQDITNTLPSPTPPLSEPLRQMLISEVASKTNPSYLDLQEELSYKLRAVLVDWLVAVHDKLKLQSETLFLAVSILDDFLSLCPVQKRHFQLLGSTCLLYTSPSPRDS